MSGIAIIGAGGHGRVVASVLQAADLDIAGFIDSGVKGNLPYPVLGTDADIASLISKGRIDQFIIGLGSVKSGASVRVRLFSDMIKAGLKPVTAVHPTASLASDIELGAGTVIMAGAILNTGVQIGKNCIINTGAIIDHDGKIGDHVHISAGATLSGNVRIGDYALVGAGSTIRQNINIGEDVTLGAGSVVVFDIPAGAVAFGNPARVR